MNISDNDFLKFYQFFLERIVVDGDGDIFFMNYYVYDMDADALYEKAIAALTRFGVSGLINQCSTECDIRSFLKYMFLNRDEEIWLDCFFIPNETSVKLVEKYLISFDEENHLKVVSDICEEFRAELRRIFDEHGVGFDVDLPYDELLSLDSD